MLTKLWKIVIAFAARAPDSATRPRLLIPHKTPSTIDTKQGWRRVPPLRRHPSQAISCAKLTRHYNTTHNTLHPLAITG